MNWKSVLLLLGFVVLFGCTQAQVESELKDEEFLAKVEASQNLGEEWIRNNFLEKGYFLYAYDPRTQKVSSENNMIRQLMMSRLVADLSTENEEYREVHEKNLKYIFEHWYQETPDGKYGYIYFGKKSKLGANAMALRTLTWSPFFYEYQEEAQKLADSIVVLMSPDGSLKPWFVEPEYKFDADRLLTFYSGEAILALLEYAEKTQDESYFEAAVKAEDFYINEYVTDLSENYYPAYVPWHTMTLNLLYKKTEDERYADAIFILNDKLLELQDLNSEITRGRFYNPKTPQYGSPHTSSDGVYTDGLAYAYEVAVLAGDKSHQEKYANALKLAVENLISLQYGPEKMPESRDLHLWGGFRVNTTNPSIRVDTVQHVLDAYRKIREVYPE